MEHYVAQGTREGCSGPWACPSIFCMQIRSTRQPERAPAQLPAPWAGLDVIARLDVDGR